MILGSFAEILSIGAVLPFLGVLTSPNRIFEHPAAKPLVQALGLTAPDQLLLPVTVAFGVAAFAAGAVRLLLIWVSTRLSFATGADISLDIYKRTLYQPYLVHASRNSSDVISAISSKAHSVVYFILMPFLTLISSGVMLVAILVALIYVDPAITLATVGGFAAIYGFIIGITRRRVAANSKRVAKETTQVIKALQEALGGIRDVLIDGSQAAYCKIYQNADLPLRRALGDNSFIGAFPRYGMEALGMILIAGLAYVISQQSDGVAKAVPVLGALAVGAQRLLPLLQQGYSSWSSILSGQASMEDALKLLDQPLPEYADKPDPEPIPFRRDISLNNLSFRYSPEAHWVLRDLNLTIPKGARIGVIGVTGCGKSTLLDIIMGLLQPTEGTLAVDGRTIDLRTHRAWQVHVAHVPQTIFLADTTIEENIAFGLRKDQIDHQRVVEAARRAQIADVIESWPDKYQTSVGERGIRLSGGQRQRIGIARALYKKADVIVFDEATSALDQETERTLMKAVEGLSKDLTILMIAHRLTTLEGCDRIIELGNGGLLRAGSYESVIDQPAKHNRP